VSNDALVWAAPVALEAWRATSTNHGWTDGNGHVWAYRDTGQQGGPVLVLLPGALGNGDTAWRIAQAFADSHRVITITYPCSASPEALADGLAGLLTHIKAPRVAVWGSSYGAWWAQAFAGKYAERVTALWLGNTMVSGDDVAHLPFFERSWLLNSSASQVVQRWHELILKRPDDELRALQLHMLHHGLPEQDFHSRLKQVAFLPALDPAAGVPMTVIADCEDDALIAAQVRTQVASRYPNATHITFTSGGHYPHVVRADEVVKAMKGWLA
jgi:maspardin